MNWVQFEKFISNLGPHDLTLAVGIERLFANSDGARVDRDAWVSGMRGGLSNVAAELGTHGATMLSSDSEALDEFLERRVIEKLERAGLARRDRLDSEWSVLVLDEPLVREVAESGHDVSGELERVLQRLGEERAQAFSSPEAEAEEESTGSQLRGEGLTKIYQRRRVVDGVDIFVQQSQIVGLLGPNGAGKTTTFYMMVGLIPPNAGAVYLDEEDLTSVPMYRRARKGMGYLAQEPSIFRKLSVEDNVRAILETLGLSRAEERERLDTLLAELGLTGLRKSKAYALSGGERRRLEITRALVQQPKFILLDEPFAGIDPIAVNDIQQIVRGLRGRGIGVIISDHNVEQTLEIVDRAYIMYEGKIRVSGTVSELVWNDEVAEIYLGPTLTARMRGRYPRPAPAVAAIGEPVTEG